MRTPPSLPGWETWKWVVGVSLDELEAQGTAAGDFPVRGAYAWRHGRLPEECRAGRSTPVTEPAGPPAEWFPVLFAPQGGPGGGRAGFVSVEFARCGPLAADDDAARAATGAAAWVGDRFREIDPVSDRPRVRILSPGGGGTSVGLSAFACAIGARLGLPFPEDLCATGEWTAGGRLGPPDPSTLPAKLAAAREWGYRRILFPGAAPPEAAGSGLRFLPVSEAPEIALLEIVRHAWPERGDLKIALALSAFDLKALRVPPEERDLGAILAATEPFTRPPASPLVLNVAHDIRSRAYLHEGRTEEAHRERLAGESAGNVLWPDGWIGEYLRWHRDAHHAVIAIDQGRWDDGEAEHRRVDESIELLEELIRRDRAGLGQWLTCMFLRNTRGLRREFLGRLGADAEMLRASWEDRVRFRDQWPQIFPYCVEKGLRDGDRNRQHNQCMSVLCSHFHLFGALPADWGPLPAFWPDFDAKPIEELGAWDLPYCLRWKHVSGQGVPEEVVERALVRAGVLCAENGRRRPYVIAYEVVLSYRLGATRQQELAAGELARSDLFAPGLSPRSIHTVIALRVEKLLAERGFAPERAAVRPEPGTALAELCGKLAAQPARIGARAPY